MPYVSHTHTLVQYTRSPTHSATVLTRSVCPSHVTVLLEAATACLLAFFSRSDFDHQSRETVSFRRAPVSGTISCWKSICWFIEHTPFPPPEETNSRRKKAPSMRILFETVPSHHSPTLRSYAHCYIYCSM